MKKIQDSRSPQKKSYSKASAEGIATLIGEIELALKWNRPAILLAVHGGTGRAETRRALEKALSEKNWKTVSIKADSENPDVIQSMCDLHEDNAIFLVSDLGKANTVSGDQVYRALNLKREALVEDCIRVIFWLDEAEAEKLPRLAPDFWAFRHRVIDFASKRGHRTPLPAGVFLLREPALNLDMQKEKFTYYENLLKHIPADEHSVTARLEIILHLAEYGWLLNQTAYLDDGLALAEKYPLPELRAWLLNIRGIALYEQGDAKNAAGHFAQAMSLDPENGALMLNAAFVEHAPGRNKNALLLAKRAIKLESRNPRFQRALGYLFFFIGRNEEALAAMRTAQEIAPDDVDSLYSLAIFHHKNGQPAECASALSKAGADSSPRGAIEQACADILNGQMDKALEGLKQSVMEDKVSRHQILRDPNLYILLGQADLMKFSVPYTQNPKGLVFLREFPINRQDL
jgi:tetratricopeptide (TPR) repeat protein